MNNEIIRLKSLQEKIELLSKFNQIEILKILQKNIKKFITYLKTFFLLSYE